MKSLNIKFKGDNKGLVSAIKGIQSSLYGVGKSLKEFKAELATLGTEMNKILKNSSSMKASMKKTEEGVDALGDEAKKTTAEIEKMNEVMKKMSGTSTNKMFTGISAGFKGMGKDIIRATKLMGTFAAITGGIQLRRATSDYLDFSNERMQLENITNVTGRPELVQKLDESISKSAVEAGVKPSEFIADIKAVISGSLPINITENTTTEEGKKMIEEVAEATKRLGLFGKAMGATTEETAIMATRMGTSMGYSSQEISDPKKIEEILGYMSVFMDESAGSLSELSTAISKPLTTGMSIPGATIESVLARIARNTKLKSVMLGARHATALSSAMGSEVTESNLIRTKVKGLLAGSKDSNGIMQPFTYGDAEQTAKTKAFLERFDSANEVMTEIYKVMGDDGVMRQALPEEALGNYVKIMKEAKEIGIGESSILQMLQGKAEVRLGIMDAYNGGLDDIENITAAFQDEDYRTGLLEKKENNTLDSFAQKYAQVVAAYSNATNQALDKLQPSLNAVGDALIGMFSGADIDIASMTEVFNENFKTLKDTNPFLAEMVNMLQSFGVYTASGDLREDFESIMATVTSIVRGIGNMVDLFKVVFDSPGAKLIRKIFGDSAGGDLIVGLTIAAGTKVLLTNTISGALGLAFSSKAVLGKATIMGSTIAAQIVAGLSGVTIALVAGTAIGAIIADYLGIGKVDEDVTKGATSDLWLQDPNNMTPADAEKWSDQVSLEEGKKYKAGFTVGSTKRKELQTGFEKTYPGESFFKTLNEGGLSAKNYEEIFGDDALSWLQSFKFDENGKSKGTSYFGLGESITPEESQTLEALIKSIEAGNKNDVYEETKRSNDLLEDIKKGIFSISGNTLNINPLTQPGGSTFKLEPNLK